MLAAHEGVGCLLDCSDQKCCPGGNVWSSIGGQACRGLEEEDVGRRARYRDGRGEWSSRRPFNVCSTPQYRDQGDSRGRS
jgi:hypothetical protein